MIKKYSELCELCASVVNTLSQETRKRHVLLLGKTIPRIQARLVEPRAHSSFRLVKDQANTPSYMSLCYPSEPLMKREEISMPQFIVRNEALLFLEKFIDGFTGPWTKGR